MPAREFVLLCC